MSNFIQKTLFSTVLSLSSLANATAATQAVVFDFGDVLTTKPNREIVVNFLQQSLHLSDEEFKKANEEKRQAIKEGSTDEEFWLSYAKAHGIKLPPDWKDQFREIMKNAIAVNPKMYELVDELKEKKVHVALLSNIDPRLGKLIQSYGYYDPFDPYLLSYEIGVEKPDPKAFGILIKTLNVPPGDILFIDDKQENVDAAKKAGIDAILFKSEPELRLELSERGLL